MRTNLFRLAAIAVLSLGSLEAFAQPHFQLCSARFIAHRDSLPNTIDFAAFSGSSNTTYTWDFGDGSTGTTATALHSYAAAGTYNVCLTVVRTDTSGATICTDTRCDSIRVGVPPPAAPVAVCSAHFRYFGRMGSSSVRFFGGRASGGYASYAWDFGDGSTDTLRNPYHAYAANGTYNACLTLTAYDSVGNVVCTDNWCDSVVVGIPHHPGGFFHSFGTAHHHRLSGDATGVEASVSVYPNPMADRAVLVLDGFDGPVSLLIYNLNGQIVLENSVLSNGEFPFEKGMLPSGVYFYQAVGTDQQVKGKLVIE